MTTVWWHGGRPHPQRRPGGSAARETGTVTAAQMLTAAGVDPGGSAWRPTGHRTDRGLLTSARDMAHAYAGPGAVRPRAARHLYQRRPRPARPSPTRIFRRTSAARASTPPYDSVLAVAERRITIDLAAFRLVMLGVHHLAGRGLPATWARLAPCPTPAARAHGCVCAALSAPDCRPARLRPGKGAGR